MPRKTRSDIHAEALQRFQLAYDANQDDRQASLDHRRFVDIRGAQWDWDTDGDFKTRMRLEVNLVALACIRIKNEYQQNQIEARFIPKDGTDADPLADLAASRYRADFQDSNGKEARDNAFDEGMKGGMGAWRLRAEYEDEDAETQRVRFEPIHDAATSWFADPNSLRKDKADAKWQFLIRRYTAPAYEAIWGEHPSSFPVDIRKTYPMTWGGIEKVLVAEYFVIEDYKGMKRVFTGIDGSVEEFMPGELDDADVEIMTAQGYVEGDPVKVKMKRVHKYTLSGGGILSDDGIIAGKRIPIVPFYGHRFVIDGVERFRGHVAMAVDPQIVQNIQFSKVAETAASSGVEKPIFTPEQIGQHANMWNNDHINNNAFLLIDPIQNIDGSTTPMGPIGFTKSPVVPEAVGALIQLSQGALVEILGNPAAGEVVQSQTSGVAMEMAQGRMDMQTSGYIDGLGDAERLAGEIWLSMAKDIYVEPGRRLKTMAETGKRGTVELGRKVLDPVSGKIETELDFANAAFDVAVEVGPSSASKRNAMVRTITNVMGVVGDQDTLSVLTNLVVMNLEGQGLDDAREWSRKKLLTMGVGTPTKEEQAAAAQAAEGAQPSSQDVLATALADKAKADAELSAARVGESLAKGEKLQAETVGILIENQSGGVNAGQ